MTKALLLLSGGIDSPVAGYLMQQQGIEVIALHFSLEPFTDNAPEIKSNKLAKTIGIKNSITITIGNEEAVIRKICTDRFFYITTRRLMLRIAEIIAKEEGCSYLITGDSLGQVGSQTLENMTVISQAVKMVILRPLLTNTKNETIAIARKINTYNDSIGPEMCSVLGPKHPATKSRLEIIEPEETKFNIQELIDSAMKTKRIELTK
ncbi:7-cyano-7-deazaguanine synthase [Candidatus Woesearchaeota archaeon]|nr:7-cyano-7-deazaguanine synthase [Candidatus Woesearchaeota archaeon]